MCRLVCGEDRDYVCLPTPPAGISRDVTFPITSLMNGGIRDVCGVSEKPFAELWFSFRRGGLKNTDQQKEGQRMRGRDEWPQTERGAGGGGGTVMMGEGEERWLRGGGGQEASK